MKIPKQFTLTIKPGDALRTDFTSHSKCAMCKAILRRFKNPKLNVSAGLGTVEINGFVYRLDSLFLDTHFEILKNKITKRTLTLNN